MICPQCYSTLEVREATVSCYTCGYSLELEYDHCLEKDCDICSPNLLIKLNAEADGRVRMHFKMPSTSAHILKMIHCMLHGIKDIEMREISMTGSLLSIAYESS